MKFVSNWLYLIDWNWLNDSDRLQLTEWNIKNETDWLKMNNLYWTTETGGSETSSIVVLWLKLTEWHVQTETNSLKLIDLKDPLKLTNLKLLNYTHWLKLADWESSCIPLAVTDYIAVTDWY